MIDDVILLLTFDFSFLLLLLDSGCGLLNFGVWFRMELMFWVFVLGVLRLPQWFRLDL